MTNIADDYPQIAAAYNRVKALNAVADAARAATMDDFDNARGMAYDFAEAEEQAARAALFALMQKAIVEREATFWVSWHTPVVQPVEVVEPVAPEPAHVEPEPPEEV